MLVFDLETDGLLDTVTKIHCMVIKRLETDEVFKFRPHQIIGGVNMLRIALNNGEKICGHNVIDFDIPCIEKLYDFFRVSRQQRSLVVDTLPMSRLIYSNVKDWDAGLMRSGKLPGRLFGRYSLEAWGYRLGTRKGDYGKSEGAWEKFSEEMLDYNELDVEVTCLLIDKLLSKNYSQRAIDLEHEAQWLMSQQVRNGFPFDLDKARELEVTLRARHAVIDAQLRQIVPQIPDKIFIPKKSNKAKGYVAGVPFQKYKDFNPNSRQQIEWLLTEHYKYKPENEDLYDFADEFNIDTARLKIDDETFAFLKNDPEAPEEVRKISAVLEEYLMVTKRLGQLSDGNQAWIMYAEQTGGFIHGSVNPNGAVTGRATHSHPNVAQVPTVGKPYGKECRELFKAPDGWLQVGVDASGLELRCLAHYMYPYDQGAYAHEILNGDIHTANQMAAGLPARNDAKRFIYAYLYGAGDAKIGKIINGDVKDGKRLKREFLKKTPALKNLKDSINNTLVEESDKGRVKKWKRKYLKGLDGRLLWIRSLHSALNTLLQSAGALICKKWICRWEERLIERGLKHGWEGDFAWMAWVHDECQVGARTPEIAEIIKEEGQNAMRDTMAFFSFRVQLDTEGKIGKNWSDCH